jgi:epoxyqueuosine reductase
LDANKCISYWTIENKGEVPAELSDRFQGWMFGCDVCQEVCPWNHKHIQDGMDRRHGSDVATARFPDSGPEWAALLKKNGGFRSRFRRTPLSRAGRRSLIRNLAIAIRNLNDTSAAEPLRIALADESDPIVRKEIERTLGALKGISGGAEAEAQDHSSTLKRIRPEK